MFDCLLRAVCLSLFFIRSHSAVGVGTESCSALSSDYTLAQMQSATVRNSQTYCNTCVCYRYGGSGCVLKNAQFYPSCSTYGSICGTGLTQNLACSSACSPGGTFTRWYCYGTSCSKTNPPPSVPACTDNNGCGQNLWTFELCLACASGTYSSDGTGCVACPAGSTCVGTGVSTPTQCTAGTYSASTTSCSQCSGGTYSGAGVSACTSCDIGYYSGAGAGSCSPCTNRPGAAFAYTSSASSNSCGYSSTPSCPAGTYAEQSSSSCKPCTSGTYQGSTTTSWATGCVTCPAGSQCPSGGLTSATPCANGFFSDAGSTICTIICAAGRFANFGQSVCSTCNAGTFS